MDVGDRLKIFPETDVDAYIRYFESIGLKSRLKRDYIEITGYYSGLRKKNKTKNFKALDEVGQRIKYIRKSMYFSTEELAKEIDTTPLTIDAWENGRIIPIGPAFNRFLEFSGATREYVVEGKGQWVDEVKQIMKDLERGDYDKR